MKNFKKVVAAGLALLMLALSVNVTFAAEEYNDAEEIAVAKVNAAGIMQGTDKGFEPTKTLTRAEAAAIMVRMKGISEETVKQNSGATLFTDVAASHWAAGYVNVASNYGIIVGVGANKFAPEKEVSVAEFYTMAVRALGAGKLVDSEGVWPTNYVNFAIENDLAEDVAQIYTATATRKTAAVIAANTLEADMWEKSLVKSNGEITWAASTKKIVEDVLKLKAYGSANDKADTKSYTVKVKSVSNVDHTVTPATGTSIKVVDTLDLSNIKAGMTYEYWMNDKSKIVGMWLPKTSEAIEFTEIKKYKSITGKDEITLVVDGKEEVYKIDDANLSALTIVNNELTETISSAADLYTAAQGQTPESGFLKPRKNIRGTAYLTEDVITQIYMTEFRTFAAVKDVTDKKVTFQNASDYVGFTSTSLSLTTKDKEYFLTKDGKAMSFTDLDEDEVIKYYTVNDSTNKIDKIVAEVVEAAASGKVTSVRKDASNKLVSIKIDGKSYDVINGDWIIKADDEITIYLNDAGKVAAYVKDKKSASNYGYINHARIYNDGYEDNIELTLVLSDGTVTDKMVVDFSETSKKNSNAAITAATAGQAPNTYAVLKAGSTVIAKLGDTVCYEIKNGKLVIKPVSADPEYAAVGADTPSNNNLVITNRTKTIDGYYLTDNTKVFKLKTITNKNYEYDVEEINVDDLDSTKVITGSYVAGINKDSKEVETFYISAATSVARTGEANFAFITNVWSTKDGDDDVNEIEVILMDGSKETYLVSKDVTLANNATVAVNKFVDLTLNNGKVTKLDLLSDTLNTNDALVREDAGKYVVKNVANSRYSYVAASASITKKDAGSVDLTTGTPKINNNNVVADDKDENGKNKVDLYLTAANTYFTTKEAAYKSLQNEFILANDLLVLEVNSKGDKWTVKDFSDIENYADVAEFDASTKLDKVVTIVTYQEDAKDTAEAVLVIFENDIERQN